MSGVTKFTSNWADEIDDEDEIISAPQEVVVKGGERMVSEIVVDPDTGAKKKITRTFRLEKKLGMSSRRRISNWTLFELNCMICMQ